MTYDDFRSEIGRLWTGFNKRGEMAIDRMAALWRRYGHHPKAVLRVAIDECLCDSNYPTRQRFDESIAAAGNSYWHEVRQSETSQRLAASEPPSSHPGFWTNIWRQNVAIWDAEMKAGIRPCATVPDQAALFHEHIDQCSNGCGSQRAALREIVQTITGA